MPTILVRLGTYRFSPLNDEMSRTEQLSSKLIFRKMNLKAFKYLETKQNFFKHFLFAEHYISPLFKKTKVIPPKC